MPLSAIVHCRSLFRLSTQVNCSSIAAPHVVAFSAAVSSFVNSAHIIPPRGTNDLCNTTMHVETQSSPAVRAINGHTFYFRAMSSDSAKRGSVYFCNYVSWREPSPHLLSAAFFSLWCQKKTSNSVNILLTKNGTGSTACRQHRIPDIV